MNERLDPLNGAYFSLDQKFIFVKGIDGAAIYDVGNGDMLALDPDIGAALALAEEGLRSDEIALRLCKDLDYVHHILQDVAIRQMGRFYDTRVYVEKYMKGLPPFMQRGDHLPPTIYQSYIELPGECHLDCSYCEHCFDVECAPEPRGRPTRTV
jgi:hypothetical protein